MEAEAWIRDRLGELGIVPVGPVERVRERTWSVHLRVSTSAGPVWFKANGAATRYEAALVAALGEWVPESVLVPLAVDIGRSWMLSLDGGPTMREAMADAPDLRRWESMLVTYAHLQRDVAVHAGELIERGVPDQSPATMPGHLAALLDDPAVRADLGPERHATLTALAPEYADWCAELATDGIPVSVQHDDLHDGNVFLDNEKMRFFDWGDAAVAHPFGSLLVALRVAALQFPHETDRLRDAYLEVWGGNRRSAELATRVAIVGRSLSWQRALEGAEDVDPDDVSAPAEWLAELVT